MRRPWPATLTGRLVATVVGIAVAATVMVALVTTVAMRGYLSSRLDQELSASLDRSVYLSLHGPSPYPGAPDGDGDGIGDGDQAPARFSQGQRTGTLTVLYGPTGSIGGIVGSHGLSPVSADLRGRVAAVPADGEPHAVALPHLGDYRMQAANTPDGRVVVGLPTQEIDSILTKLVASEVLLGLGAATAAAVVGQLLVRRQLRPLREVAATAHRVATLPLSSGAIGETVRVPDDLTDPANEVGQVGAALNTMLEHVEDALDARHRSEQQVRQFVADASHELRTPLSTIQGYAELSRRTRPADPAQLETALHKVESEAQRMSRLVEDLLLLARLDSGRPLDRGQVDLTKLALEAVDDARVVDPDRRYLLDLPEEPVVVTGDEHRLHQVLTNLLNNARRHTPAGTTVAVAACAHPDQVLLTVHDDGPGLPPELVGRAFERFTRGDSSRTRSSGGVGLGLSLVHAITAAHGGHVSVRSRPGDTTFTVSLPA